jgi:hypothetical protein
MPRCTNKVTLYIERGFKHREIKLDCTSTGPSGELILCKTCEEAGRRKPIEQRSEEINAWMRSANWGEA